MANLPKANAEEWAELEDWEEWDPSKGSLLAHATAGSIAGAAEHCVMFPFDTIKTHMQVQGSGSSSFQEVFAQFGSRRLWRGVSTMLTGCVPAHAAYFSIYEQGKVHFGANGDGHTPLAAGATGALATVAHDIIMTPMDVVKQRMQLGFHSGIFDSFRAIIRTEGVSALYLSLPTTLIMNMPYASLMVATNESIKKVINPSNEYNLAAFFVSGAGAGAVAAALTNPLDVVKTRLQTQSIYASHKFPSKSSKPESLGRNNLRTHSSGVKRQNSFKAKAEASSGSGWWEGFDKRKRGLVGTTQHLSLIRGTYNTTSGGPFNSSFTGGTGSKVGKKLSTAASRKTYNGFFDTVRQIYVDEGARAFVRGLKPRLMAHTPSVAISWATYETAKNTLISSGVV